MTALAARLPNKLLVKLALKAAMAGVYSKKIVAAKLLKL
jgi:hypothetical protein